MKRFVVLVVIFCSLNTANAQYDSFLESIIAVPDNKPTSLTDFDIRNGVIDSDQFFELEVGAINVQYYPPHRTDCGFFMINKKVYESKYPDALHSTFGCNLDGTSLKAYQYQLDKKNYLIVTAVGQVNGRGTRIVFCHLFDVTNLTDVRSYFFWSLYGSGLSFGDYNHDSKIDFLETRYDYSNDKTNDQKLCKITPWLFNERANSFEKDESHFIVFETTGDLKPPTRLISKKWYN